MEAFMEAILQGITTTGGLLWKAFWALAIGYAFSSLIQIFITHETAAKYLGKGTAKELVRAGLLGFISSSCSFAALSATRSLFTKGAALKSALAYMFASTNLAIEVAALAYIFLGREYAVALFVGAPILIIIQSLLVSLTKPKKLTADALEHARKVDASSHKHGTETTKKPFLKKLKSRESRIKTGIAYIAEWKMVYKELIIGFLIAGFVAALVPASFFQAIFPTDLPSWLLLPLQALMAPFLAIITVIGSMGNGPLAAILANNGIVFGAIMAFLYADFNVPPAVKINANYYGWRFALYIAFITALSAVLAGIVIHLIYAGLGLLPGDVPSIQELATFEIDYTFRLNMVALLIAGILVYFAKKGGGKMNDEMNHEHAHCEHHQH